MRVRTVTALLTVSAAIAVGAAMLPLQDKSAKPDQKAEAKKPDQKSDHKPKKAKTVSPEERLDALSRAVVWQAPPPIARAKLSADPRQAKMLTCTFDIAQVNGTAPKFECQLASGDKIRVKYGRTPEVPSEVATTRLLHAIGFGADTMTLYETVRCYGCPAEPFITMKTLGFAGAQDLYGKVMNPTSYKDFEWAAVEKKHPGRPIETEEIEGWAFFELDLIDPKKGGAPRAHVDALRLLAVMLGHWDNKTENQRLVCTSQDDWPEGGKCRRPLALLQDVGSAWGPRKVDLEEWKKAPIWTDRQTCTTSMDHLPYHGATFKPVKITDGGRTHLGGLLSQLTDGQLHDLFVSARFDHVSGMLGNRKPAPVEEWVAAFKTKVSQITDGPSCPQ
jgi:hypothetical protein